MKRYHLIELEDLNFWPRTFRDGCTEYLESIACEVNLYQALAPRLILAMRKCQATNVLDLCSGAGGPWMHLLPQFHALGFHPRVLLTDKFPNLAAFSRLETVMPDVSPVPFSVDAANVPSTLNGFRTLFSAFHHLRPQVARDVLSAAVRDNQGIAVFEFSKRSSRSVLMAFLIPVMVLLFTPCVRPFRWSRLFWTYILPVLPLVIFFDGLVSCLRTYTPEELFAMVTEIDSDSYEWDIGVENSPDMNIPITYLIGVPSG